LDIDRAAAATALYQLQRSLRSDDIIVISGEGDRVAQVVIRNIEETRCAV